MKAKIFFLILFVTMNLQAQLTWNFTSGMEGWHDLGTGRDVMESWEAGKLKMAYIDGGNAGTQLWFPAIQVDNLNFNAADYKFLQINYQTLAWPTTSPVKMLATFTKTDNSVVYSYFDIDPTKNFLSVDIQANNPGWAQAYSGTIKSVQLELPHNGDAASATATNWYSASTLIDRIQLSNTQTSFWEFGSSTEGWSPYGDDVTTTQNNSNLIVGYTGGGDGAYGYPTIYKDVSIQAADINKFYMKYKANNWIKSSVLVNIVFEIGATSYYANKILQASESEFSLDIRSEVLHQWNVLPASGTISRIRIELPHNSESTNPADWNGSNFEIDKIVLSKESDVTEAIISADETLSSFVNGSTTDIFLSSGYSLTVNTAASVKSITLSPGAKLTLSSGTLTATNGITLQSSTSGTATFVDNNNASPQAVSGTIEQHLSTARNWYLSSPIAGATIPAGQTYYSYDETGSNTGFVAPATAYWVAVPEGTTINPMKGYITQPGAATTKSYTGTFNTGTKTIALTRTNSASKPGFNLVANPYPSYLDWSMVDTTAANIHTSVWYRTKTSGGAYTFDTYNGKLDVATTNGENTVSKLIPPMQAFWVRVKTGFAGGTLTFDNTMRKHADVSGNKMKAPKVSETKVVRLQLSNGTNADEALVCFNSNAQNSFDSYDSPKMFESSATRPELYTLAGNEKVVINGLSDLNGLNSDMELPLGFTTNTGGNFTLKATEIASFDNSRKLYLRDKQENSETELTPETEYAFSTTAATSNNESRFSLLFKAPGVTTGTINTDSTNNEQVSVFVNTQNKITIIAKENSNYSIFNATGQLITTGKTGDQPVTLNATKTGVYIVSVNGQSNRVIIQ